MLNLNDKSQETLVENPQQKRKLILALAGAGLILIGIFLPIVSLPIVGSVNYFNNGQGDGLIVLALAVIAVILALARKFRFVTFAGLAALALITYTLFRLISGINSAKAEMERSLAGNPFKGFGDAFLTSIQVQWGWLPLIAGSFLVITSGLIPPEMLKDGQTPAPMQSNRTVFQIMGALGLIFFALILIAAYVPLGTSLPSSIADKRASGTNLLGNPTSSSNTSGGTAASKPSPENDPEKQAYLPFVKINNVEVGRTVLEEPGIFGEVKNTGSRTLSKVEITIYFLNNQGEAVYEKEFPAVFVGSGSFTRDDKPLKPGYSQKFGVKADDAPSEWAKTVNIKVSDVEFEK